MPVQVDLLREFRFRVWAYGDGAAARRMSTLCWDGLLLVHGERCAGGVLQHQGHALHHRVASGLFCGAGKVYNSAAADSSVLGCLRQIPTRGGVLHQEVRPPVAARRSPTR